jgi:hypothetical protein
MPKKQNMEKALIQRFKQFLTIIGTWISAPRLHQLQLGINYLKLGRWMAKNGFKIKRRVLHRDDVFAAVAEQVRDTQVLYLEFGVFKGASTRYWSNALKNPASRLFGFDSFEGLPEDFDGEGPYMKGTFDVKGAIPQIDDPRVEFVKGWFEDTLPTFQVPEHEALVIIMDADLFSSTDCVLQHLRPFIKIGTFIYFDEMSRPDHEPAAFKKFILETGYLFRLESADYSLNRVFFKRIQ